jgi:hypothetical protein
MPPSPDTRPVDWVTSDIIRQHFNDSQILEQVESGELNAIVKRDSHRAPPGEPHCTKSQIVYYYTQSGDLLAVAHQYLRPDGTIGASGRPDPKRLCMQDRILAVRHKQSD